MYGYYKIESCVGNLSIWKLMKLPACSVISPSTSSSISTRRYLAVETFIAKNNPKVISCIAFIFDGYKSFCLEIPLVFQIWCFSWNRWRYRLIWSLFSLSSIDWIIPYQLCQLTCHVITQGRIVMTYGVF